MQKAIRMFLSAALALGLGLSAAGCAKDLPAESSSQTAAATPQSEPVSEAPQHEGILNPLTGTYDLDESAVGKRPAAVMVNNIKAAWDVQTGLAKADIIYETYVEGGITRLMAVFKDAANMPEIGCVRSARYSYVDLAAGHDALYIHAGMDTKYCKDRMSDLGVEDLDLLTNLDPAAYRLKNGKATEHTLYTSGKKLAENWKKGQRLELKGEEKPWLSFLPPEEPAAPGDGVCGELEVPFSSQYTAGFSYDPDTQKYRKSQSGNASIDYKTEERVQVKNILVLYAPVEDFSDGEHVKTELTGGEGLYVSQGGYANITWSKAAADAPIRIEAAGGGDVQVNAGNTWVCLVDEDKKDGVTISE